MKTMVDWMNPFTVPTVSCLLSDNSFYTYYWHKYTVLDEITISFICSIGNSALIGCHRGAGMGRWRLSPSVMDVSGKWTGHSYN